MNNAVVQATANKLAQLWPGRKIYVNEVPAGADDSFFISLVNPASTAELDRRRMREFGVTVVYFTAEHNNMDYYEWADAMFANFESLAVNGRLYHTRNRHAQQVGRDYHFLFDINARVMLPPPEGEPMQTLHTKRSNGHG